MSLFSKGCGVLVAVMVAFFAILPATPAKAQDRVGTESIVFSTDWKAQAEHGGFYQALARGFYRDAGLNVTIRPGGPQTDNTRLIAAGALDLAIASNSFQPVNLIAAGADAKVVMASFQKDPQVLIVHPHVEASSIADLKGRPVFLSDTAIAAFFPWLKANFGFQDKDIRKYTYSLAPWLVNKETVQEGYLSSEPFTAQQQGITPKVFLFADAGYPGYAGMVLVRGAYLREKPDVVRAFVAATIKGWQDYMSGDPAPGNALILEDNPEMTPELLAYARSVMIKNNMVGEGQAVGAMTPARWHQFYDTMSALGAVPEGINIDDVYTTAFFPQIYSP